MHFTSIDIASWVTAYIWPFIRIGAMLAVAPIFSARMVPVRMRVLLAVLITIIVTPLLPPAPAVDVLSAVGVTVTIHQILIGVTMGFIMQLVFSAITMAGQIVAMGMGLGFASMVDPQNGISVPVLSQFFLILATLIFLALDGHLLLIEAVIASFQSMPVAPTGIARDGLWQFVSWGSVMFSGAVLVAIPAVTAIMLINLAFGIMTKAAPQLNIFSVGFPVTMLSGFIIVLVTLPGIAPHLSGLMRDALTLAYSITGGG